MPRRHTLSVVTERVERTQGDPWGWVPYNPPAASREKSRQKIAAHPTACPMAQGDSPCESPFVLSYSVLSYMAHIA